MRADKAISDVVETITLTLGQLGATHALSWPFAERPKIRAEHSMMAAQILVRAIVDYAEQKCKPVTYPADWWQAVKQRFAPAWALKRWPVKLIVWEPFVIYPEIKLPREKHYVQIRKLDYLPSSWSD